MAELSRRFDVHPNMIGNWKREFQERASQVFDSGNPASEPGVDPEKLYAEIGKLRIENEFLKKSCHKAGLL